jgi:hypothetical protein
VQGSYPSPIGGNHFTPGFADFDNDGDLDLAVGAISHPDYPQSDPTLLFVNQGPPSFEFTEESYDRGLIYREDEKHVHWADLDGDGQLDLITTGFRAAHENELRVYHQQPDHSFVLVSVTETGIDDSHQESIALLDFDGDGDLDLYLAEDDGAATLWENTVGHLNHRVVFSLVADAPRDATGARITLVGTAGRQLREVAGPMGHYNVQASRTQYFGLGGDTCAQDVMVRWPDGTEQALGDLAADAHYEVVQGESPQIRARY